MTRSRADDMFYEHLILQITMPVIQKWLYTIIETSDFITITISTIPSHGAPTIKGIYPI